MAVFNSWMGNKAVEYRRIERITGLKGTAVNVQAMVFGNTGNDSGTGVAFTRDPNTGENEFYGDYLINAQGEDVVAGIRTPEPISRLKEEMPKVYEQLLEIRKKLETHYKEMQDIEFTVQDGTLYMLQTRTGKRTGTAAVRIAVEMVKERSDRRDDRDQAGQPRQPQPPAPAPARSQGQAEGGRARDRRQPRGGLRQGRPLGRGGRRASRSSTRTTRSCWSARRPAPKTSPACTWPRASSRRPAARPATRRSSRGAGASRASSAATPSRSTRRPGTITIGGQTVKAGDFVTIDGTTGDVMIGKVPTVDPHDLGRLRHVDGVGRQGPHAEDPHQRRHARGLGPGPRRSVPRGSACAAPSTCSSASSGSSPCGR